MPKMAPVASSAEKEGDVCWMCLGVLGEPVGELDVVEPKLSWAVVGVSPVVDCCGASWRKKVGLIKNSIFTKSEKL